MSHHARHGIFAQTTSPVHPFYLPKIEKNEAKPPKTGSGPGDGTATSTLPCRSETRRTLLNRRSQTTWECTYRPKARGGFPSLDANWGAPETPKNRIASIQQASDEEGTCRRLMMANETIERQRLFRLMSQGNSAGMVGGQFAENEERGVRLLASQDYAGARVCFSRAIRQNTHAKLSYAKRAICNWHLLLYDECIEDSRKVIEQDFELVTLLCRSLVLRGRYQEARQWYSYAQQELAPSLEDPYNIKWRTEFAAILSLEQFRTLVDSKKWRDSMYVKDAAKPLIDDTPLVLLEAKVLLHVNPKMARLRIMQYMPTIIRQTPKNKEISLEESAAWRSLDEHYLHTLFLLAQTNAYCGNQFLALAAALVQTCLTINPDFGPALLLGHYLVSLEEILVGVASLFEQKRYAEAIPLIQNGLQLDKSNRLMCSILYCLRADAYAHLGKDMHVINDCTAAIEMDPNCAKAYACRAEVYHKMNQRMEAAINRLTAVRLNPALRHILRGDEEQFVSQARASSPLHDTQRSQDGRTRWYDIFMTRRHHPLHEFSQPAGGTTLPQAPSRSPKPEISATLYDDLELRQGASVDAVRTQFKKLTLLYHPDRVVQETPATQQAALERFKLISRAHEILADPAEKRLYDLSLGIQTSAVY